MTAFLCTQYAVQTSKGIKKVAHHRRINDPDVCLDYGAFIEEEVAPPDQRLAWFRPEAFGMFRDFVVKLLVMMTHPCIE